MKELIIGCDNAAVGLKETLKNFLTGKGYHVEDIGCADETDVTFYPYIAERVCQAVKDSGFTKEGILLCGTGMGMAISANKIPGIRAAVCHDSYSAERAKLSNNANILCMGARVIGPELAKQLAVEWLSLEFTDGPSTPKVHAVQELESRYLA